MNITACKNKLVVAVPKPNEFDRYSFNLTDVRMGLIYSVGTDCDKALNSKAMSKITFGSQFAEIPVESKDYHFIVMHESNAHAVIE